MRIFYKISKSLIVATALVSFASPAKADEPDAQLILAGDSYVTIVQRSTIPSYTYNLSYREERLWEWNARNAYWEIGNGINDMHHVDEAKPLDGGDKILVTSSYNWCVIVDRATKKVLFYTTKCSGAHSAEILPGNRVVVASTTANGELQLYDMDKSNEVLYRSEKADYHGVVWDEKRQRLYAVGAKKLHVFSLKNWDTDAPELHLENTITTPKASCHDLTRIDEDRLLVAGRGVYFFDMDKGTFTEQKFFSGSTALKSVNYNVNTGEFWYTDSTNPEGDHDWSTQTVHHTFNGQEGPDDFTFKTLGLNLYKVRVLNWDASKDGIDHVEADEIASDVALVKWYNLQGQLVETPAQGVNIRVQNGTASKVMIH